MDRKRLRMFRAAVVLGLTVSLGTFASASAQPNRQGSSTHFNHIIMIMMENTGFGTLIGNKNAPWINSAVKKYLVEADYYGVTHPSQPNYIASTSGSLNGVNSDNDTSLNVRNVVDQLAQKNLTWHAYMQGLTECATGVSSPTTIAGESDYKFAHACGNSYYGAQLYERKHDPFVTYQDIATNPQRMTNIYDLAHLTADLKLGDDFPNYAWISPDQCHDMHGLSAPTTSDPCDFSQIQSLISMGDTFLKDTVHQIMSSSVWKDNTAIFITWDEADYTGSGFQGFGDDSGCCDSPSGQGGGHVLTLIITKNNESRNGQRVLFQPANHFSMLAAIEQNFHLGCLANTCDTANVQPLSGLR